MPEDEFSSKIINILISKLKDISSTELTDFLVDKLVDEAVNEYKKGISSLNDFLTDYSEGKNFS